MDPRQRHQGEPNQLVTQIADHRHAIPYLQVRPRRRLGGAKAPAAPKEINGDSAKA